MGFTESRLWAVAAAHIRRYVRESWMTGLRVLAAGSNAHGQLANETLDDSHALQFCIFACEDGSLQHQLPGDSVVSIASGANHTLLLLERHSAGNKPQIELWGCGDGRRGQLGPGYLEDSVDQRKPAVFRRVDQDILDAVGVDQEAYNITHIAASWESSYVVLQQQGARQSRRDIIISMGSNDFRDLGVHISPGSKSKTGGPYRVALDAAFKAYVVTSFQVMGIAAGTHHVVATVRLILDHGEKEAIVGWGACRHGQLSTDSQRPANIQATTAPRIISLGLTSSDITPDTVVSFALGNYHTSLLHRSGRVTGLGSNKKGQLTGLQTQIGAKNVHCTWNGTYLIFGNNSELQEWEIRATGSHDKGQLGCPPASVAVTPQVVRFPFGHTTHRLLGIACGSEHVLALFAVTNGIDTADGGDTEVWGWGWNEHGNLALGHVHDVHIPTRIWPQRTQKSEPARVMGVWAGCGTSWIVEAR